MVFPVSKTLGVIFTLIASCLLAEFFGYWLHRLLHSDRIGFLSRGHLIHHFLIYGPGQPMRHAEYHDATDSRLSVGNVGLEWLVPSAILLALLWIVMRFAHVAALYQAVAFVTLVAWPSFMFSYLHDRLHLSDFWMIRNPIFRGWFLHARRLHDIHHHSIDDRGHMDANFGIGLFWFDRLFLTIRSRHRTFNRTGFEVARDRYGLVERDGRLHPSTDLTIYSNVSGS
jgi:sterol desaturase/sphingolipid hydroxylase (fatty acid hydroxylase superfamily)